MDGEPTFFATPADFREWLDKNHENEKELWVGYHKVSTGKPSMTWSQSVDEALCYGWIDGIRKSVNDESYKIRFTPRKPTSVWSKVNVEKVKQLKKQGLMLPAGLAAYDKLDERKSAIYSFEQMDAKLKLEWEKQFKANKKAWQFFQSQAPSYQKQAKWWVMSAKQEVTRERRMQTLIADSQVGMKIKQMRRSGDKGA